MQANELWMTEDRSRFFLIPRDNELNSGPMRIIGLQGFARHVAPADVISFEITEEQARRIAKDQLSQALGEFRQGIDEKLADLRRALEEKDRTPVAEGSTVTPNAVPALFDFLKKLPGVIGNSLSGEDNRVAAARGAMADLQRQLKDAGIDVGDGLVRFSDRLADLQRDVEQQKTASDPTTNEPPDKQ
ncbi:MAG: hypothetical protein NC238_05255 [Dehalobacter sp.]|nr:hypothetical protein [Dehalobacter sp.]